MINNKLSATLAYKVFCFSVAVAVATILASLPVEQFVDRNNYLTYSTYAYDILLSRINNGIVSFFFNEPFWVIVNLLISKLLSPESTIRAIILFSAFSTVYLVLRNNSPKYILLLLAFLLLPQVLKNNVIHLRQGLAVALFLWGWFSVSRNVRYTFFGLAALVHTSFIIVIFGMIVVSFLSGLRVSNGIRNLIYVSVGLGIALFGLVIASYFGARQADRYSEISANISGFGFLFWSGILGLFILQGKNFIEKNSISLFFIFLYLATYFSLPVTGRVLESVLLVILISALELKNWKKLLFVFVYLMYFILNWLPRLNQPWFGWGVANY